jgi:fumarate hydratase subunit beta
VNREHETPAQNVKCNPDEPVKAENIQKAVRIHTPLTDEICTALRAGDAVLLSGTVFTARDVAHRRISEALQRGEGPPVPLEGETIFYAGPTPAPPARTIGSVGPTTSGRMDIYTPALLDAGLKGMIGKGKRSAAVREAIRRNRAVYFAAIGGVAALLSRCVTAAEVIAYEDLGTEAIRRLSIADFPLIVINDPEGRDLYEEVMKNVCDRQS